MYFLKMFKVFSTYVLSCFLIATFSGLHSNHIHGYHLRAIPSLSEEHYRNRGLLPNRGGEDTESDVVWLNPGKRGLPNFTPYISVGVLSNLEEFFDNLSSNMDSIDEEKAVVNEIEDDQRLKLKNPLAENYFRGYKPSYKIRNYVQSPDLGSLKGTNHHDPSLKWTGLGKRNRL